MWYARQWSQRLPVNLPIRYVGRLPQSKEDMWSGPVGLLVRSHKMVPGVGERPEGRGWDFLKPILALYVTYYTSRCECDKPLQAILKICLSIIDLGGHTHLWCQKRPSAVKVCNLDTNHIWTYWKCATNYTYEVFKFCIGLRKNNDKSLFA